MSDLMRSEFARIVGVQWLEEAEVCKLWSLAWKASRESMVIAMPVVTEFSACDKPSYVLDRCKRMVEMQGPKVTP